MNSFNEVPCTANELQYIQKALQSSKIYGYNFFISQCTQWFKDTLGCKVAILKSSLNTDLFDSRNYNFTGKKEERVLELCKKAVATVYLSGSAIKDYLDEDLLLKEGIKVEWMDYNGYPEYRQLYPPFEHGVSSIDLIFNEGPNAKKFMKSFGATK